LALNGLFCADVPLRNYSLIGRLSLETKPRPKSWPTSSIVWRRLYLCLTRRRFLSADFVGRQNGPTLSMDRGVCLSVV